MINESLINTTISNDAFVSTTISNDALINTTVSNDTLINTTISNDLYVNTTISNDSEIKVSITSEGIRGVDGKSLEYMWEGTSLGVKNSTETDYSFVNLGVGKIETFVYTQQASSSTWTISHDMGKYPSVTVVDSAGSIVIGEVAYSSITTVVVSFTSEFSGKAYLN